MSVQVSADEDEDAGYINIFNTEIESYDFEPDRKRRENPPDVKTKRGIPTNYHNIISQNPSCDKFINYYCYGATVVYNIILNKMLRSEFYFLGPNSGKSFRPPDNRIQLEIYGADYECDGPRTMKKGVQLNLARFIWKPGASDVDEAAYEYGMVIKKNNKLVMEPKDWHNHRTTKHQKNQSNVCITVLMRMSKFCLTRVW